MLTKFEGSQKVPKMLSDVLLERYTAENVNVVTKCLEERLTAKKTNELEYEKPSSASKTPTAVKSQINASDESNVGSTATNPAKVGKARSDEAEVEEKPSNKRQKTEEVAEFSLKEEQEEKAAEAKQD